jgi:hypothetical protein
MPNVPRAAVEMDVGHHFLGRVSSGLFVCSQQIRQSQATYRQSASLKKAR